MNKRFLNSCIEFQKSLGVIGVLLLTASPVGADEVVVARFSTVQPVHTITQRDPLEGLVTLTFPDSVTQVGQAVNALLAGSGYRLASLRSAAPERVQLLALPLPGAHRTLGPMPLRRALQTLVGPAFVVVEDPVHRLVSFERCAFARGGPQS